MKVCGECGYWKQVYICGGCHRKLEYTSSRAYDDSCKYYKQRTRTKYEEVEYKIHKWIVNDIRQRRNKPLTYRELIDVRKMWGLPPAYSFKAEYMRKMLG